MSLFVKFLVVGGVSAALNALSRMGFSLVFSLEIAVCLAYGVGMVCAYGLSRIFVFEQSGRSVRSEFVRFAIVNVFALLVVLGVTMFLARVAFPFIGFTWHAETVAHIAGILAPVFTSYLGHKHFTFQPKVKPI
jgi:putative flippase GtrA